MPRASFEITLLPSWDGHLCASTPGSYFYQQGLFSITLKTMDRMGNLGKLPAEVLIEILKLVGTDELDVLSRACKSLRSLTVPYLYQDVRFDLVRRKFYQHFPAIPALFRSIHEHRDLARYVKHVTFGANFDEYTRSTDFRVDLPYLSKVPEHEFECALSAIGNVGFPTQAAAEWAEGLLLGSPTEWMALLLSQLQDIESLEIEHGIVMVDWYISKILAPGSYGSGQGVTCRFNSLKEVTLSPNRDWTWHQQWYLAPIKFLIGLFTLPSMDKIDMILPEPDRIDKISLKRISMSFSLRKLVFRHSEVGFRSLGRILRATPHLEALQYDFVQNMDQIAYSFSRIAPWAELNRVLQAVKQSLKTLRVSTDWYWTDDEKDGGWVWPDDSWKQRGRLGSLQEFEQLHTVDIPIHVLLGWNPEHAPKLRDVLPRNLRELCLRDDLIEWDTYQWMFSQYRGLPRYDRVRFKGVTDPEPIMNCLEDYLDPKSRHGSKLSSISLYQKKGCQWSWKAQHLESFRSMCEKAGITGKILMRIAHSDQGDLALSRSDQDSWVPDGVDDVIWEAMTPNSWYISGNYDEEEIDTDLVKEVTIYGSASQTHVEAHDVVRIIHMPSRVCEKHF
jgi:hypothetical protein